MQKAVLHVEIEYGILSNKMLAILKIKVCLLVPCSQMAYWVNCKSGARHSKILSRQF